MTGPVETKPKEKQFDPAVAAALAREVVTGQKPGFMSLAEGARVVPKSVVDKAYGAPISEFVGGGHEVAAQVSPEALAGLIHGGLEVTKKGVVL
jgi:hypothetical protein